MEIFILHTDYHNNTMENWKSVRVFETLEKAQQEFESIIDDYENNENDYDIDSYSFEHTDNYYYCQETGNYYNHLILSIEKGVLE